MKEEGKWHWLYCCEEGWVYTLHTQGADKLTLNFGLKYSKEGPPKKAFEEDIEHRVSLPSSLVISGSFFHHLMLLLRLNEVRLLNVNNDLFKLPTYNYTIKCSMKICLVVINHLFRIQTNYLTFDIQHHKLLMSLKKLSVRPVIR